MRKMLDALRISFLVSLAALVLAALFFATLLIYMPIMALVATPFTVMGTALAGITPRAEINTLTAVVFSVGLAYATVLLVFRVLLRRARARRHARLAA